MFRLAADTLHFFNSFPALIPDFDSRHSRTVVVNSQNDCPSIPVESQDACRIIVFIHCHYPDLLVYFTPYLNRISDYDLIVTIMSPHLESLVSEWAYTLKPNVNKPRRLSIKYFSNNGRDVKPFWETGIEIAHDYTVFLKLHTKSSPQYKDFAGLSWLKNILDNLLTDSSTIHQIVSIIHAKKYGAVFPLPWKPFRHWGWANRQNLYRSVEVCRVLSINPSILYNPLQYPVGNMYWGSTSIFKSYGEKIVSSLSWPEEPLPADGTLLHSLERMTGYLYTTLKMKIAFSACMKSTDRGGRVYSWDADDQANQYCDSFLLGNKDVNSSSLTGHFCTASSITSSMIPKENILFKPRILAFIRNIISYPRYGKRRFLGDLIYLSSQHFSSDSLINSCTSEANPFLNPNSSFVDE